MNDLPLPQRRSPRLQGYDYSQNGVYFVTICTYERFHHFGYIINDRMHLSSAGRLAVKYWQLIPEHYLSIELDTFVVMPNHIHGIIINHDSGKTKLGTVIGTYKAAVTRVVNQRNPHHNRLWQSRYHDHVIRNQETWDKIREYVLTNPQRWQEDSLYSDM